MQRVWISEYVPTDEKYEQIELEIVNDELVNPFENILKK